MNLIIIGCGRIGSELALDASQQGHQITIVDRVRSAFDRLGEDFHGRMLDGDAMDRQVIERAGIEQAEGLAAVTSDDATNFVVARYASLIYHLPNVVARVYDPTRLRSFEALGIQGVASSSWGARRVEQLLTHPGTKPLATLGHEEVSIVELHVPPEIVGKPLEAMQNYGRLAVSAVLRGGSASLPDPGMLLEKDDLIVAAVPREDLMRWQELIASPEGRE